MTDPLLFAFGVGMFAILVASYITRWILKRDSGTARMREVSSYIVIGTNAYLKRQLRTIVLVIPWLAIIILFFFNWTTSLAFVCGVFLSLLAGYVGMNVAVRANVRTANAATHSLGETLRIGFLGGSVMGLAVPGISLVALYVLRLIFYNPSDPLTLQVLVGFGFGASLQALFAQIGGGIYTKPADIGADLVGKIEMEIPEDDPRNPAVIADLVGDNVGDCAGRGSDLFESISDDYITAMILGAILLSPLGINALMFPLMLGASGILGTIVGVFVIRGWKKIRPIMSFNNGLLITAIVSMIGAAISSIVLLNNVTIFYAVVSGLVASLGVGLVVQYYIGINGRPVRKVAESSERGAAINIITGMSYAFQSPFVPLLAVLASILFSYFITNGNLYGLVAANLGTDLAIGIIMSSDTFGPISDNAAGIAEMSRTT